MSAFAAASLFFYRPQKIQTEAAGLELSDCTAVRYTPGRISVRWFILSSLSITYSLSIIPLQCAKSKTGGAKTRAKITCSSCGFQL